MVAAGIEGARDAQLIAEAERDDGPGGMHAGVQGARRAARARARPWQPKVGEDHVDRVRTELGRGRGGTVGLVDGVPVGIQLGRGELGGGCGRDGR
jgi:hypothetical protein